MSLPAPCCTLVLIGYTEHDKEILVSHSCKGGADMSKIHAQERRGLRQLFTWFLCAQSGLKDNGC